MPAPRLQPSDAVIARMSEKDRKELGLSTRKDISEALDLKAEAQIQKEVEAYLKINGFWPRTPEFLDGRQPRSGWYIHLYKTKKNPYLLDLLIWTLDGKMVLEMEAKSSTGSVREEQAVILSTTECAVLFRSTEEGIELIRQRLGDYLRHE